MKRKYFDMYCAAMTTNFMVAETKEEVLDRPAIIATKTHYYYKGELIDEKPVPANCVIIQAGQYCIPVWLLTKEQDGHIHLTCGYLNTYHSPVKYSQNQTKLKDWFIENVKHSKIINLNAKNSAKDLYGLKYGGKDLRFSVFGKDWTFYIDRNKYENGEHPAKKHLCYKEPEYVENILHPVTLNLLFNNGVNETTLAAFNNKERSKCLTFSLNQPIKTEYLKKGLYSYLLHHAVKETSFPQEMEEPTSLISEYNGSIMIHNTSLESIYYFYKNSVLVYRKITDKYMYSRKQNITIGEIIEGLWNDENRYINNSVDELYDIIVNSLPLIYKIGNYKYTLGYFIQITDWIKLPISQVFKLFVIIQILQKHPNDHYFEMWLKYQLTKKTSLEWRDFLTVQFQNIESYGLRWYTKDYKTWDYRFNRYGNCSYPVTPQEWHSCINVLWYKIFNQNTNTWSGEKTIGEIYPELNQYLHFPHLLRDCSSDLLSPTWGYKNLQEQLHMSFSMFKGFLKEKPFEDNAQILSNWHFFMKICRYCFRDDTSSWSYLKKTEIIKKISSITYEQYQTIMSVSNDNWWGIASVFRHLQDFVYGSNTVMTVTSLCKAIMWFKKNNEEMNLNSWDECIRQVSNPNSLLMRTECPRFLSQCNYNYISNWARREDVLHLAEMLDHSNSDTSVLWQNKMEGLRNNKYSLSIYLRILHDFYFQVDNNLHQQAILLEEAELNKNFVNVSSELEKYIYSDDKLLIRPPKDIIELQNEGQILHHCVFGFRKKMVNKQSFIFFIRNKTSETIPYYTVELVNGPEKFIRQVHGDHNSQPTPEIVEFLKGWVKKFKFNPEVKNSYSALG